MNEVSQHISAATWTQLILSLAGALGALATYLNSRTNTKKLDENTGITRNIANATGTGAYPIYKPADSEKKDGS